MGRECTLRAIDWHYCNLRVSRTPLVPVGITKISVAGLCSSFSTKLHCGKVAECVKMCSVIKGACTTDGTLLLLLCNVHASQPVYVIVLQPQMLSTLPL